jgi:hypothetical protein
MNVSSRDRDIRGCEMGFNRLQVLLELPEARFFFFWQDSKNLQESIYQSIRYDIIPSI